jgi:hypothetical protein
MGRGHWRPAAARLPQRAARTAGQGFISLPHLGQMMGEPRDRSHYERFANYHATFYRDVEPTAHLWLERQGLARGGD